MNIRLCKRTINAFLGIISWCFASTIYASTITVNCRNQLTSPPTPLPDRVAIQNAINKASSGDVINLVGTCQIGDSPIVVEQSNISIVGAGAAGNWTTVLIGLVNSNGIPLTDKPAPSFQYFNRGISIGPSNKTISNVTIQGIKFKNLTNGVNISPSISGNTNLCSGIQITNGNASNINVANNWFDHVFGGFNIGSFAAVNNAGISDHINIINNLFTNDGVSSNDPGDFTGDIRSVGQVVFCFNPNGSLNALPLGTIASVNVSGNIIKNDLSSIPIIMVDDNATINNNTITVGPNVLAGMDLGTLNSSIKGNIVDMQGLTTLGIVLDTPNVPYTQLPSWLVINNTIQNSVSQNGVGIVVENGISGANMINNVFSNISSADYLLCDANGNTNTTAAANCFEGGGKASFNNQVVLTNPNTTVMDLGTNNKVIGNK